MAQVAMRAIVADDHPLYRAAVRLQLEQSFPAADIAGSVERGRVGAPWRRLTWPGSTSSCST
jgi:DNA-binding NarL/FixJ family response regulator